MITEDDMNDKHAVSIKGGEFKWSREAVESTLEDIDLEVKMGELIGVFGRVGCGKTSLLSAIVGEMIRTEGSVDVFGSIAYAPQNPWILSATVRDNITFFRQFKPDFYEVVLEGRLNRLIWLSRCYLRTRFRSMRAKTGPCSPA